MKLKNEKNRLANSGTIISAAAFIILAVLGALAVYSYQGFSIGPTIDDAYAYALNVFFARGAQAGRDYIFTYGPLGFLMFPQPVYGNLETANILLFLISLMLSAATAAYIINFHRGKTMLLKGLLFFISVLAYKALFLLDSGAVIILALVFAAAYLYDSTGKSGFLVLACAALAAAVCIKQSHGIFAGVFLVIYGAVVFAEKRVFKPLAIILTAPALFCVFLWLALYGRLDGLLTYFISAAVFLSGNASAMSLGINNNWVLIFTAAAVLLAAVRAAGDEKTQKTFIIFTPLFLMAFRYGSIRADQWHYKLMLEMFLIFCLMTVMRAGSVKKILILAAASVLFLVLMSANMRNIPGDEGPGQFVRQAAESIQRNGFFAGVKKFSAFKDELAGASAEFLGSISLAEKLKNKTGQNTVDFYPYTGMGADPSGVLWKPRPVFQSYISYSPWLDSRNSRYFSGKNPPEFIILDNLSGEFTGIDGRYVFNDEPLTVMEILKNYRPVEEAGRHILMEKSREPRAWREKVSKKSTASVKTFIMLPEQKYDAAVAKIEMKRTFYGAAKNFFWLEKPVYILYFPEKGPVIKRRLVVGNMKSGTWADPYVTGMTHDNGAVSFTGIKIKYIGIEPEDMAAFEKDFYITWHIYNIAG